MLETAKCIQFKKNGRYSQSHRSNDNTNIVFIEAVTTFLITINANFKGYLS